MAKLFVTLAIFFIFATVAVKAIVFQQTTDTLAAKLEECKEEVGAKDSDVNELLSGNASSTKEGKCLRSCIMKKTAVMDDKGKLNKDVALTLSSKNLKASDEKMKIFSEIIDKCSGTEMSDDHCEAAEEYGNCLKEQASAHNMNF